MSGISLESLKRNFPRLTPSAFAEYASDGAWKLYPHIKLVEKALMKVVAGKTRRLIISMPPQHGKSVFTSQHFPTWFLGNMPSKRVILCSYEADYAASWGRKVRDALLEHGDLFGVRVSRKTKAASRWEIEKHGGYMVSVGIGGPITGKSADLAIIDDPIKNAEEAASATIRKKHKEWFSTTLETRMSKDGCIILIMTRWHEDDLAGWLIRQGGWEVLALPAICPSPDEMPQGAAEYFGADVLGRQPGEPLCPDLHPLKKLEAHRSSLGEIGFWGLYQQYPFSPAGGVFKREHWLRWLPNQLPMDFDGDKFAYRKGAKPFKRVMASWDFTYGSKTGRSWCVGQVWGETGKDYWLIYQIRERWDQNQMVEGVENVQQLFPMLNGHLIEAQAAGPYVVRSLRKKVRGVIPVTVRGSKVARANAIAPTVAGGNVWIPEPTLYPWVEGYVDEFAAFPLGSTDDQVDTTSQYLNHVDASKFVVHSK